MRDEGLFFVFVSYLQVSFDRRKGRFLYLLHFIFTLTALQLDQSLPYSSAASNLSDITDVVVGQD